MRTRRRLGRRELHETFLRLGLDEDVAHRVPTVAEVERVPLVSPRVPDVEPVAADEVLGEDRV